MMRKIASIAIATIMTLGLVACTETTEVSDKSEDSGKQSIGGDTIHTGPVTLDDGREVHCIYVIGYHEGALDCFE